MSPFFIKHPVIATVIAVVTTLLGLVCLVNLPVSQYPEITPRTIQLMAMFPGADAKAVSEQTLVLGLGVTIHDVRFYGLHAQRDSGQTVCDQIDPQQMDGQ